MAKVFYTERDIEDMVARGINSLVVNDDVVLTELAYERAKRLGLKLDKDNVVPPSAPVRPYISETNKPAAPAAACPICPPEKAPAADASLKERVRNAVKQRFGDKIDEKLLDAIIQRVLNSVGV